ncbi:MAG: hypothetical protein U0996_04620 [Planctomycetaceae bacterium]
MPFRQWMRLRVTLAVLGLMLIAGPAVSTANAGDAEKEFATTHKQVRIIKPMHDGKAIQLNTFCLDREGNIVACVGGTAPEYVMNPDGSQQVRVVEMPNLVQVYSPEGELLRSTETAFRPTAVNVSPDGTVFVAGDGKIAKIAADGKILQSADSPHIGDIETFKQRIIESAKKQAEENVARYRQQITTIEERIKALKDKPEADRTEVETKRLATYEQQKGLYENQLKIMEKTNVSATASDAAVARKLGITALAVTSKDVFVCAVSVEGAGYEVWRSTHEFSEPVRVVRNMGGCCGQCDIQATEEHLVLAENTKFKVALLDRDGKRVFDFGKGDRKAVDGFGSCCNPMNVRCCDNGDILTAESSIGTIKRFNDKGELVGVVGKARIGGGCKHVALGYDSKRDRYYMMNVDRDHICVMLPNAEAPELTSEEQMAKTAREGLGQKLVGVWTLTGSQPEATQTKSVPAVRIIARPAVIAPAAPSDKAEPKAASDEKEAKAEQKAEAKVSPKVVKPAAPLVRIATTNTYSATKLAFAADGSMAVDGGISSTGDLAWEPIRQDGNTLYVSKIQGDIQYYEFKVEFISDDEANISLLLNERVLSSNRYQRAKDQPEEPKAEETKNE